MADAARAKLEWLAQYVTRQWFLSTEAQIDGAKTPAEQTPAYWLDYQCCPPPEKGQLMDQHVNTICGVVRSARKVIVALPYAPDSARVGYNYLQWGESHGRCPRSYLPTAISRSAGPMPRKHQAHTSVERSLNAMSKPGQRWK